MATWEDEELRASSFGEGQISAHPDLRHPFVPTLTIREMQKHQNENMRSEAPRNIRNTEVPKPWNTYTNRLRSIEL